MKFGMGLGLFFAIYYLTCIAFYLIAPGMGAGHAVLALLLPALDVAELLPETVQSSGYVCRVDLRPPLQLLWGAPANLMRVPHRPVWT